MSDKQLSPFLTVSPTELEFLFELKQHSSCFMQLTNKTPRYVAFKISTTDPNEYCMRPNIGIVSPGAKCDVRVLKRAVQEAPPDMQCKASFLVQSVVVAVGTTKQDITPKLFDKVRRIVGEFKLNAIFIHVNPTSLVPQVSDEGFQQAENLKKKDDSQPHLVEVNKHDSSQSPVKRLYNAKYKKKKSFRASQTYPHPRHLCSIYPFNKTPHEIHCSMCYCYVCDEPAPCKKWAKSVPIFAAGLSIGPPCFNLAFQCEVSLTGKMHCHATEDKFWRRQRELETSKTKPQTK